mgnify:CR=1 FL=1
MTEKAKIWYSINGGKSEEDDLGYYDNQTFSWVNQLEKNHKIIKEEEKNLALSS